MTGEFLDLTLILSWPKINKKLNKLMRLNVAEANIDIFTINLL
jgi:hypothetical protein